MVIININSNSQNVSPFIFKMVWRMTKILCIPPAQVHRLAFGNHCYTLC